MSSELALAWSLKLAAWSMFYVSIGIRIEWRRAAAMASG